MNRIASVPQAGRLALWGGVECTVNRVGDEFFSQLDRNGHASRPHDIDRFAGLGLKAIRYPALWERIAPDSAAEPDWSWTDRQLPALQRAVITVIAGRTGATTGP